MSHVSLYTMELNWSTTSLNNEIIKRHGNHETQMLEGTEADLYKHFSNCEKNPGHRQFIPVEEFRLKDIPESHQDEELYEYIKAASDLTVRISVTKTSPERPKFWPGTTEPYPFNNSSGSLTNRLGTGRVWFVNKFQDGVKQHGGVGVTDYKQCWCTNCKTSDSPSNVWWEFYVYTATHVVFDETEASGTNLRLFYDTEDSPVVIVKTCSVYNVNIENDVCKLKCVTCDQNLGDKLKKMWKHYKNVSERVNFNYSSSRKKHKLTFIVSHPHGCSKKVSVGQWKEKQDNSDGTKFTYTTCTCPGSSGANVQCVGYNDGYWSHLLHCGTLTSGLNYSAVAVV